jgi:hypothetical protein
MAVGAYRFAGIDYDCNFAAAVELLLFARFGPANHSEKRRAANNLGSITTGSLPRFSV